MTTEKQNLALAKLLLEEIVIYSLDNPNGICWKDTDKTITDREWLKVAYLCEEKIIKDEDLQEEYGNQLIKLLPTHKQDLYFALPHAAFEQRREALLRTLNLWEE